MIVLVTGATGNLGSRVIPALLTHDHTVVAYVRSASKLNSLLPPSISERITIVEGSFTDPAQLTSALIQHRCDAVIQCAGNPAIAPWSSSNFPALFATVVTAIRDAQTERVKAGSHAPIRAWFLGGMGALDFPTASEADTSSPVLLNRYMYIILEHTPNYNSLQKVPTSEVAWSFLCPSFMEARVQHADMMVPASTRVRPLVAAAGAPPGWSFSFTDGIPILGPLIALFRNALRYTIGLEDMAEFLAADLDKGTESEWVGKKVGIIDAEKV